MDISNRRALILAVISLLSLIVSGSDESSVFQFYQTLSTTNQQVDIFQQSSILYINNTGYAFTFGLHVYVTDLFPFLNASQTEPPDINTYAGYTQTYTLSAPSSESFNSASFYTSASNASNSGCYVTGTNYIFQYDANTWALKRSIPSPQSDGLENTFIDGKLMFASLRAQNLIYVFDLEAFTLGTTKNYTVPFVTKATLIDSSRHLGYFFSSEGQVQVWNTSALNVYRNLDLNAGSGVDYQLTSVYLDEVRQILYVGMNSGTNGPPILQIIDLTATYRSSDGVPVLISQVVLDSNPLSWTSLFVDTAGGQAFAGLIDGNNGQFCRVDLSTYAVVETIYVAVGDNGHVALSFRLGVQRQSLVLYSESAINVYTYPAISTGVTSTTTVTSSNAITSSASSSDATTSTSNASTSSDNLTLSTGPIGSSTDIKRGSAVRASLSIFTLLVSFLLL
ncbi:hypothetical protein PROFUN_01032 [Planoprotostelium fungivorum]|uniref:Uncharacterized protein n=1 Tax=Planoprotostelium fungivorum TaxID=1890364 RepID=A0A2P6N4H5_9EUKA|nr:hypothetical protein PROFUN_01032 [Planoprotostelium fungivorum]